MFLRPMPVPVMQRHFEVSRHGPHVPPATLDISSLGTKDGVITLRALSLTPSSFLAQQAISKCT